uniref:SPG21 abhydrolase domain containing, maspardin n=1 Tax=Hucho hucho TaxID=62062 RepID=A0A4W5PF48_9TELE
MEEIRISPDYNWFRSTVPLKKIIVDDDDSKVWSLYDAGPKSIRCPIIFLPPVSGTAEVFFQQVLALTGWGYRVISVSHCERTPLWHLFQDIRYTRLGLPYRLCDAYLFSVEATSEKQTFSLLGHPP